MFKFKKDISIIIPVYNEEGNIPELVSSLREARQGFARRSEVIFVDDGSSDSSFKILKGLKEGGEDIRIMRFRKIVLISG